MIRLLIGAVIGAVAGGLLGYYGQCTSGMCPLTSNPWIGALVGSFMGAMVAATTGQPGQG
ncbi:MAG: hypothetical protein A2498_02440 [Lentisphaerae bacterium RIFOXYC12_FULL_60_16]|nr:MAG: hypothetical protein A2498_02440 [Lentisphaerae bacterium RIFOXYC12_FULL_60_16]OGV74475.1 MAG: hypothetical protein A2269_06650 [Lentisphaerae bacterium RIFOXYA12_FULL_60_10]OGV76031.1 MAG: hypothetical protein A2340_10640 [Lentisphaerae bacterium RIFOXYB12_FULL_60_10]